MGVDAVGVPFLGEPATGIKGEGEVVVAGAPDAYEVAPARGTPGVPRCCAATLPLPAGSYSMRVALPAASMTRIWRSASS